MCHRHALLVPPVEPVWAARLRDTFPELTELAWVVVFEVIRLCRDGGQGGRRDTGGLPQLTWHARLGAEMITISRDESRTAYLELRRISLAASRIASAASWNR